VKTQILLWIYPLLVVAAIFYLLLRSHETAAGLALVVGGFMIPVMVFLSCWFRYEDKNKSAKKSRQRPENKRWLYGLFFMALISSVALFFMDYKDAAIVMALVLLVIQRVGRV